MFWEGYEKEVNVVIIVILDILDFVFDLKR